MARFKPVHKGLKLLPVDFDQQLVPGTFEHALNYLVDHELDLSALEARYRNDQQGASAYAPAVLLKVVLLAYSRGIVGSRRIKRPAGRTSCSWRYPVIPNPISPPWPPSSPIWATWPPNSSPRC